MSQVATRVKNQIKTDYINIVGVRKGFKLPTVKELASRYEVSLPTIGKAVEILAAEGVVTKRRGSGIYIEELPPVSTQIKGVKEKRIGFVAGILHDQIAFQLLEGIERVVRQNGAILELAKSEWNIEEERAQIISMKNRGCEGVVLFPNALRTQGDYLAKELLDFNIVVVDLYKPEMKRPHVIFDNVTATYQLTKSLIQSGRKKIVLLKAGTNYIGRSVQDRIIGYKKALAEAGRNNLEYILSFEEINDIGMQNYFNALTKLISSEVNADAIILPCDSSVPLAIRFLRAKGYKVPEDVMLIGFDNNANGRTEDWPTTNPDFRFMGERAAELIFDRLHGTSEGYVEIVLPVPLLYAPSISDFHSDVRSVIDKAVSCNPVGIKTGNAQ
jgi:DNA-binding LacI/PurR family transcriptional regulator